MALTLATELANYAAGIGTQGATLKVDSANKRVGVGTTNPQGPEGSLQVGTGITFFGNTGIISAIGGKFSGDFTVGGTLTYEDVQNVNSSGVGTFSGGINVVGGGLTVTGLTTIFGGSDTGNILQISGADSTSETLEAGIVSGNAQLTATHASGGSNSCGLIFRTRTGSSGTTEKLRITSGGNVGIGTINPSKLLELAQSNSTAYSATDFDQDYQVLKLRNYTNDKSVGMQFLIGNNGEAAITAHEEDADGETTLAFGVRGSGSRAERLHITSAGSVGINTDDPDSMLTIAGTSGDNARIEIKRTASSTGGYVGAVNFTALDGHSVASVSARSDGDNEGAHLIIRTTSAAAENSPFGANTFERLRVTSAGLVGIATVLPEAQLTVKGDNDLDAPPNKYLYSDGHGIQIRGGESALDIVSSDDGSHASSVLLRSSSDGFAAVFNPTLNQLEIKYFVPSANDFTVHAAGNFVSTLNTALRIGSTGICTATQLFEESNRVATTGKAIAMAFIFG